MYGIRYLVIALGGPDETVEEEDCEALKDFLEERAQPIVVTKLSERVSNKLTLALLHERGVL